MREIKEILRAFLGTATFGGRQEYIPLLLENTNLPYYFLHILHGTALFISQGRITTAI